MNYGQDNFQRVPTPVLSPQQQQGMNNEYEVRISKKAFLAKDPLALLMFAYYADTQAFVNAFAAKGILVHTDWPTGQKDLESLAVLHNKGADIAGRVRTDRNVPVFFDVMQVYSGINISKDSIMQAPIKFV